MSDTRIIPGEDIEDIVIRPWLARLLGMALAIVSLMMYLFILGVCVAEKSTRPWVLEETPLQQVSALLSIGGGILVVWL